MREVELVADKTGGRVEPVDAELIPKQFSVAQ